MPDYDLRHIDISHLVSAERYKSRSSGPRASYQRERDAHTDRLRAEMDAAGRVIALPEFEAITKRCVIDVLDHKHLNADVPEFAELNPSVENITMVIWDKLADRFGAAQLRKVRVWETAKTYAEYAGA